MSSDPRGPAILDDDDSIVASPRSTPVWPGREPLESHVPAHVSAESLSASPIAGPVLLDASHEKDRRIDHAWEEATRVTPRPSPAGLSSLWWILISAIVLVVGTAAIGSVHYVQSQFAAAAWLGWATLIVIGGATAAFGFGLYREISGLLSVTSLDDARLTLRDDSVDLAPARIAALSWLRRMSRRGIDVSLSRERVASARSTAELRSALTSSVLLRLDREADDIVKAAALQIAAATALTPVPAIDSAFYILRGVRLIREVAAVYGMRPGLLGTCALLRRVVLGSAVVAAADFAGQVVVQGLTSSKILEKVAGDVAATAAAWQRMQRLGRAAIAACRIIADRSGEDGAAKSDA